MEIKDAVSALSALAQESRLAIFRLLVEAGSEGLAAGAIAGRLGISAPTLSFHLAALARAGLVTQRRDGRYLYYAADFDAMNRLVGYLTDQCCGGRPELCAPGAAAVPMPRIIPKTQSRSPAMSADVYHVLFLCTGNSARSILAEALMNHLGNGRFRAYSGGSHPGGIVNRFALELLEKNGLPTRGLRSKSWDEFAQPGAPRIDFVFTVCDSAAGEVCPVWPGQPVTAHWGIEDPSFVPGSDDDRRRAFLQAYNELRRRIELFLSLPIGKLDRPALKSRLDEIGRLGTEEAAR